MNIGEVVKGIFSFLFEDATQTYVKPFFDLMKMVALSPETLAKMPFIDSMIGITKAIGLAILLLTASWQLFKSMYPLFIESDSPLRIGIRTFIAGFLIFNIDGILYYIVGSVSLIIQAITDNQSWEAEGLFELYMRITGNGGINMLLMIFLLFKCIGLFYRMFQRLAMAAVMILCSPIAVAAMISKPTEGFWQGFVKLFVGNILIQILQAICFVAMMACFFKIGDDSVSSSGTFYIMLTIVLVGLANKLEDIVRDVSISVGIGRDMQGALGKMQGMAYTVMTTQSVISRFKV